MLVQADRVTFSGPLRERTPLPHRYLHHSALDPLVLRSRFHPSKRSIQVCAAGVRCFIDWSLRFAGLSNDIPVLARCIYLGQGYKRRTLHQCTCHVDRSRHTYPGPRYLCRRPPTAYDLESPDNKTGENCCQRHVPSGVLVRSISSLQRLALIDTKQHRCGEFDQASKTNQCRT